jgi:hypothetical protein
MSSTTSRYYGIEKAKLKRQDGGEIVYFRRRILPDASKMDVQTEHTVVQGDRLDNITARYIGDPEQFWRVCDANNAMNPSDLTAEIGKRLRIPMIQAGSR